MKRNKKTSTNSRNCL